MQQIPEEGRLFQTVDRNYKEVMRHCVKNPKVRKNAFTFTESKSKTIIFWLINWIIC